MSETEVIRVENLSVSFPRRGDVETLAVRDVSFTLSEGEIVGLVGESACGKSTLGMALLSMVQSPGRITNGSITFEGRDLLAMNERELRTVRGNQISLIVQDALSTMNPVTTVQEQVAELIRDHEGGRMRTLRDRVVTILEQVQLPRAEEQLRRYPHELSGGMQQRVAIAEGLILGPRLIVADEPTTALDVTVQAQILELLREACESSEAAVLFITHDLSAVAEICDRVLVMYSGRIVEAGAVFDVFDAPRHPYTKALLKGLLPLDGPIPERLDALLGQPPAPGEWPTGCAFRPRCPMFERLGEPEVCVTDLPAMDDTAFHKGACHFSDQVS